MAYSNFTSTNSILPRDPAEIVTAALSREGINPEQMGVFGTGYLRLLKGRPHLAVGIHTLLRHPIALFIAICQVLFVYVFAHDVSQFIFRHDNLIWLDYPVWLIGNSTAAELAILYVAAVALPLFLLNLSWGLMAGVICRRRFNPFAMLSGLTGLLPLRLFAESVMPPWWFFRLEWRLDAALAARILQLSWAYKVATRRNWNDVEIDWAIALDRHTKPLLDGLLSYVAQPALFGAAALLVSWVAEYFIEGSLFGNATNSDPSSYFSLIALVASWIAFERACLGAMVFRYLDESSAGGQISHPHYSQSARDNAPIRLYLLFIFGTIISTIFFAGHRAPATEESVMVSDTPFSPFTEIPAPPSGPLWFSPVLSELGQELPGIFGMIAPQNDGASYYVVIQGVNRRPLLRAFIRSGETKLFSLPAGFYSAKAYRGTAWHGEKHMFGPMSKAMAVKDSVIVCPHPMLKSTNAVAGEVSRACEAGLSIDKRPAVSGILLCEGYVAQIRTPLSLGFQCSPPVVGVEPR